ncbi:MAG: 3-deoxy-D-manno-octulosonic acid transferase [Rhodobacteraceae bacterium]|nr:3-deoxy-D-manno-octulosonic acid transferase [Paracoccaceae bacterium]MCB1344255.1 3-deoxy-D-manno-octulosonic acid transferase [Paracoccaceae bacterium]
MARSLALCAYLAFSERATGFGTRLLDRRRAEGRESSDRVDERKGIASAPRPDGTLIWFHAASVGESLSLLEVIRRLGKTDPALSFLVTTGTVTSAEVLSARLPDRTLHQFVPIDVAPFVRRFLDHWKPDLAIWTESEFWPALITTAHARGVPLLLLNARLSARSARRWRWLPNAARRLLGCFDAVQAQDDVTATALRRMGLPPEKLTVTGTLKEGTPPPPCDEAERNRLVKLIGDRPVWLAASTHPGEEALVAQAHRAARRSLIRLLLILVPRHPERADDISAALIADGFTVARRSAGEDPGPETQIFLADTLGELGLWYRLAPISFVGGSLTDIGGHNPYEPAALGSAILHGPHVRNFRDIFDRLDAFGGARCVTDAASLTAAVTDLMRPDHRAPMAYAAWEVSSAGADVTDKALALILDHLPGGADAGSA